MGGDEWTAPNYDGDESLGGEKRVDLAKILQGWKAYNQRKVGQEYTDTPNKENERVVSHTAFGTKMVGYASLLTGLTFSVLTLTGHVPLIGHVPLTCLTLIILIGACITFGLATQVLGNKIGAGAVARFTLVGFTGAAITYSLYHAANDGIISATSSAHHADLLLVLQANTMAMGAFLGIFVVFFVGTKLLGGSGFMGRFKVFKEFELAQLGIVFAMTGMLGVGLNLVPFDGTVPTGEAVAYVNMASLIILWLGLAFFAYGFLKGPKGENRPEILLSVATIITLTAGAGVVVGAGFQVGTEALHPIGTEIMVYSGVAFVGLLATMCIVFTIRNKCRNAPGAIPEPVPYVAAGGGAYKR